MAFSRSIGRLLLALLLALLLLSQASLLANPLDEITQILKDYEQHTSNLSKNINSLSSRLTDLESSYQRQTSQLKILQSSLDKAKFSLSEQEKTLTISQGKLTVSLQQIKGLETGYSDMEKRLKRQQVITKVAIGAGVGLMVSHLLPLEPEWAWSLGLMALCSLSFYIIF